MLYLNTNTASQTLRLSLNESRFWFDDAFTNYLIVLEKKDTRELFYLVADVDSENERYTEITIGTDSDDGVNSSVLITDAGQYIYTVYGQNSATNLDPDDADVVGVCERGQMFISSGVTFTTESTTTIPAGDVIEDE